MIGRVLWLAALLAAAVVTAGLQVDRQSAFDPALAGAVPEPFRFFAQAHRAAAAVQQGNTNNALKEARLLVQRRPVPAEHLTLLAAAQTNAGMLEEAGLTIQAAARRGWREPLAQESMLRLALAAGDQSEAARRYTALLLRTATPDAVLQDLGKQVLGTAGSPGRQTMIEIVSEAERWQPTFLRRGPNVIAPDAYVEIVEGSIAQGAAFDCALLEQIVKGLESRGDAKARVIASAVETCQQN